MSASSLQQRLKKQHRAATVCSAGGNTLWEPKKKNASCCWSLLTEHLRHVFIFASVVRKCDDRTQAADVLLFNTLLSFTAEEAQWDSSASLMLTEIAIKSTESSATNSKLNMFTEIRELFFTSYICNRTENFPVGTAGVNISQQQFLARRERFGVRLRHLDAPSVWVRGCDWCGNFQAIACWFNNHLLHHLKSQITNLCWSKHVTTTTVVMFSFLSYYQRYFGLLILGRLSCLCFFRWIYFGFLLPPKPSWIPVALYML